MNLVVALCSCNICIALCVYVRCRSDRPSSSLGQRSALKGCPMCMQSLHFCPVCICTLQVGQAKLKSWAAKRIKGLPNVHAILTFLPCICTLQVGQAKLKSWAAKRIKGLPNTQAILTLHAILTFL